MTILEWPIVLIGTQTLTFMVAYKWHHKRKQERFQKFLTTISKSYRMSRQERDFCTRVMAYTLRQDAWLAIMMFFPGSAIFLLIHDLFTRKDNV